MTEDTNSTPTKINQRNSGYPTLVDTSIVHVDGVKVLADSRCVAGSFVKRHDGVIRDIRNLIAKEPSLGIHNFVEFKIKDLRGESTSHYMMDRRGFTLLAMGFTGEKALQWKMHFIDAFEAMERELADGRAQSMTPAEAHLEQAKLMVAMERRQLEIAAKQEEQDTTIRAAVERLNQIETASDHFTCIGYARWAKSISIDLKTAAELGRRATRRANQLGIKVSKVPDPRFGTVSQYPKAILDFAWEDCFPAQRAAH